MMMFLMRLPLQTRYTILSEECSCPTMPDDDEDAFFWMPVISLIDARGHSMPFSWHNVLSFLHVQQSPASHKPPHTSSYNTACSIRCNTKRRPNHRAPKPLVVLLPVAYFLCGRKRLLRFQLSARYTGRNVFGAVPSVSQTVCPLCLQVFLLWVDLLDL